MTEPKKVADTLSRNTLTGYAATDLAGFEPDTRPLRIGASIPVSLIRDAYETGGISKALEVGRACFSDSDDSHNDGKILAIARREATLRGFTPEIAYHDEPCATCRGEGKVKRYIGGPVKSRYVTEPCETCHGDGFAPPNPNPIKER